MSGETLLADSTFVSTYYMNAVRPLEEDLVDGAKWTWDEVNWFQRLNLDDHEPLRPDDFEVAIICALPLGANAVLSAFDHLWDFGSTYKFKMAINDFNFYSVGVMSGRNVILAHPPHPGKATAATTAAACAMSFKNIKLALVVGVCGVVPFTQENEEILLGDVIISKGVIQYDNGRQLSDSFSRKIDVEASLGRPNARVGSFMAALETPYYRSSIQAKINQFLEDMDNSGMLNCYPGPAEDKLYESSYSHKHHDTTSRRCKVCTSCQQGDDPVCNEAIHLSCRGTGCEDTRLVQRSRQNQKHRPVPHIGLIASGDSVIKSSAHRDQLARKENVIAFEMEGAGVWDAMACVIIKGACDYADSHKNKLWQEYAATTAAACAKAFIQYW
ncbi:Pfs, NB-ARC and TPR domain protein [Aspergillus venezuelensis]